jgi:hypothetical protein
MSEVQGASVNPSLRRQRAERDAEILRLRAQVGPWNEDIKMRGMEFDASGQYVLYDPKHQLKCFRYHIVKKPQYPLEPPPGYPEEDVCPQGTAGFNAEHSDGDAEDDGFPEFSPIEPRW